MEFEEYQVKGIKTLEYQMKKLKQLLIPWMENIYIAQSKNGEGKD